MRTLTLTTIISLMVGLTAALIGCSSEGENRQLSGNAPNIDSIAREAALAQQQPMRIRNHGVEPRVLLDQPNEMENRPIYAAVTGVNVVDSMVYASYEGGTLIYDLATDSHRVVGKDMPITTVVWHDGALWGGGDRLYKCVGDTFVPTEDSFGGNITTLYSYGAALLVGTEYGLYSKTALGVTPLMEGPWITSMVSDAQGLWVGTDGDGLYHWDGQQFTQRYLQRDPGLFDCINCLAYGHGHLYVGTPNGLFIHDGGSWHPLTTDSCLPSNNVTAVDASNWVVYIGTDQGVSSYFNGAVNPVRRLEGQSTTALKQTYRGLLVGTDYDGLLIRQGAAVRTLYAPKLVEDNLAVLAAR